MSDLGGFDPPTAKMILGTVRYLKANGFVVASGQKRPQANANSQADPPLFFRNDSGETIPPYACMQVTGTVEVGGQNYFTVDKPADEDGTSGAYLFNLRRSVAADEYGNGDAGVETRSVTDGSVSAGDRVSPTTGSWKTKKDSAGLFIAGGADDISDDVFRLFLQSGGSSGGGSIIEFEITEASAASESTSSSVSGSSSEGDSTLCDDQANDAPDSATARVIRRPCGSSSVPGEEGGFVTVYDSAAGGFLKERQAAELAGKRGFAAYLSNPDYEEPETSGSSSVSSSIDTEPRCQWIIIWIDWFRTVTGVKDIIFGESTITVERHNFKVWDDCDLADEIIEGTDCDEGSSSSGSS
jgi:hypothetical protein